ncbi:unnamed protein product [Oikopleura dioica]|uniref:Uncharacterized protein n=1 Tax=Oikopleura dioica TaxID=34765 RepID=E4Z3W2_OIKDI|nr:unnamed protein product [Oikopleura dioica]
MFTLILGAIFPAKTIDRFSVLKFIFVIMTMGGIVLISVGGTEELYVDASTGTILSLISTAVYLNIFNRNASHFWARHGHRRSNVFRLYRPLHAYDVLARAGGTPPDRDRELHSSKYN